MSSYCAEAIEIVASQRETTLWHVYRQSPHLHAFGRRGA
jgi:hypothetical protein